MIKPSIKTSLMTFFLCSQFIISAAFASEHASSSTGGLQLSEDKQTVPFHFKIGAGVPGTTNPNGTEACVHNFDAVPRVTSMDPKEWLRLGDNRDHTATHFLGAIPGINLTPTANIFLEYLQFSLLPPVIKGGHLRQEKTVYSRTLSLLNHMMSGDKTYKEVTENHVGCHLFMPKKRTEGVGAVLLLPGSKGARISELFARAKTYATQGVPCLVPDFVSTAKTNRLLGGNSTIGNQLAVSFFGNAFSIMSCHHMLQNWNAIDPTRIVWDCESIGSTQALLALAPEVIAKFEEDFIPPVHILMNDFSPTLVTSELKDSPFWEIPKTIWGGTADKFTPIEQVERFLERCPEKHRKKTTLITHDGHHDARSRDADTPLQAGGGPYELEDATNYTGLCASMRPSVEDIRETIGALSVDASEEDIMGVLGGIFGKLRLHLRDEDEGLDTAGVMKRIGALPKGGTFGPSSTEKADELRAEVIKTALKYAKPPLGDDEDL